MNRIVLLIACLLLMATTVKAAGPMLHAAGDDQHLWILLPGDGDESTWGLAHVGSRGGQTDYRIVRRFESPPVAMCAFEGTLWLVFNSGKASRKRLEFYRLQAEYQSSLDMYVTKPPDGLDMLPPVKDIEHLFQFVGTPGGPILIGESDSRDEPGADSSHLVGRQFRQGRWESLELPSTFDSSQPLFAVQTLRGLLMAQPVGTSLSTWTRGADGAGTTALLDDVADVESLVAVDGQPLLVQSVSQTDLELSYLQPSGRWPLATLLRPEGEWAVVGQRGTVTVIAVKDDVITVDMIDAITGDVSGVNVLEPVSMLNTGLWSIAIAVGLASMVILVILLARGGDLSSMIVPEGWVVLSPIARFTAFLLDMFPGLLVFFLAVPGDWRLLVRAPLMSLDSMDYGPYLVLVAVTLGWCIAFEASTGTTPGKRVFGAVVRTTSGDRPGFKAVLVRNVMKGFVLLVPPLVVLTLLHPNQQGIGDLMARSLVLRKTGKRDLQSP